MYKRYFRWKDFPCSATEAEWIEMTGKEFYHFINSQEGQSRHFIDMDDVVLETTEAEARKYRAERNHHYYMQSQEDGWSTLSIYDILGKDGCSGEDVIADGSLDVELEVISHIEREMLRRALAQLDTDNLLLLQALYLAEMPQTERDAARKRGVSQNAIHKQKKKILKFLVVKLEKSQQ